MQLPTSSSSVRSRAATSARDTEAPCSSTTDCRRLLGSTWALALSCGQSKNKHFLVSCAALGQSC